MNCLTFLPLLATLLIFSTSSSKSSTEKLDLIGFTSSSSSSFCAPSHLRAHKRAYFRLLSKLHSEGHQEWINVSCMFIFKAISEDAGNLPCVILNSFTRIDIFPHDVLRCPSCSKNRSSHTVHIMSNVTTSSNHCISAY